MELDDAYDNVKAVPDAEAYPDRWLAEAEAFRKRMGACNRARLGLMYGQGPRNALDLFAPVGRREGLAVFVHGGYWRRFGRDYFSHLADGPLLEHWAVAMPSYHLCPQVRISDIVREVAEAVAVAAREVPDLPIRLVGHSAGGHLVARLTQPGFLPEEVASRLERVLAVSPLGDLRPLLRTSINDDLHLDAAEAEAESPVLHAPPQVPTTVWVGGNELPAFVEQARALARAWGGEPVIEPGRNHFDVVESLAEQDGALTRALLV